MNLPGVSPSLFTVIELDLSFFLSDRSIFSSPAAAAAAAAAAASSCSSSSHLSFASSSLFLQCGGRGVLQGLLDCFSYS